MNRLSVLVYACAILAGIGGCTPAPPPEYDNSNQILLENTVADLDVGQHLQQLISRGSKVALVSMEKYDTPDSPIVALIEDGVINSLVAGGFSVLERDRELLNRLVSEQQNDRYGIPYYPDPAATDTLHTQRPDLFVLATEVEAADYILSYRILECGIVYKKCKKRGHVTRESLSRLHLRLGRAPAGEILFADTIASSRLDTIPRANLGKLANYHYSTLYKHKYPNMRKWEVDGSPLYAPVGTPYHAPGND